MHPIRTAILGIAFALGLISSASAIPFSFTTIDVPGSVGTTAQDINNAGDIVGQFSALQPAPFRQAGYLLSGGTFTNIIVPDAPRTSATNINNLGQIVGFSQNTDRTISIGYLLSGGKVHHNQPGGRGGLFCQWYQRQWQYCWA